jgi:predicted phage terminase large subunit-like protein
MKQTLKTIDNYLWMLYPHIFAYVASKAKWIPYKFLRYISDVISNAIFDGAGRIIINVPPRHGKSMFVSFWLPCWFLNLYPHKNVLLVSYEADFAASFGRRVRNELMSNPKLRVPINVDTTAANRWYTSEGGGMVSMGIGGAITGRGADLIIVDDPIKNWIEATSQTYQERTFDWFRSVLLTRCEPHTTVILLMTRWHENDLTGKLLRYHADEWQHISLPAICNSDNDPIGRKIGEALCPQRFDLQKLEKLKKSLGTHIFNAMYQQEPTNPKAVIKRHHFRFYESLDTQAFEEIFQSWDLALTDNEKSSFVVGQVWGVKNGDYYLIDQIRAQLDFSDTIKAFISLSEQYPKAYKKIVENKASGLPLISILRRRVYGIIAHNPQGSKLMRLMSVLHLFEAGRVYLPAHAQWVEDYIYELTTFPDCEHDDQVDATTQALYLFQSSKSYDKITPLEILKNKYDLEV